MIICPNCQHENVEGAVYCVECGAQIDAILWGSEQFTDRLRAAYAEGVLTAERLSDV